MVRRLNIEGDGQGDTQGHGGEQRAVLVYQLPSYLHWQQHFQRSGFEYGEFGENLTVDGLADDEVCIGDRYRIGEAEFEVTQPRVTCYRVGLRLGQPELPALLVSHHRPGFYMRVIREGRIQAGNPIVRTRTVPDALTVADTDALLYLPERDVEQLRRALDMPALSPGWQGSFRDLLGAAEQGSAAGAGGRYGEPAWSGFRSLMVADVVAETAAVSSIYLTSSDGSPLPEARGGQYLTIRVPRAGVPAPVRSYSLSAFPAAGRYRISVKQEPKGVASSYLTEKLRPGEQVPTAAPRGSFVLDGRPDPVLLLSAGIGLTPVFAMLDELVARQSKREVWWVHGARGPREHALAAETRALLARLPHTHAQVFYSAATPAELRRADAEPGRLNGQRLAVLGVPTSASAYVCGPASFMADMRQALTESGIDPARIHTELFGAEPPVNPGVTGQRRVPPHQPSATPGDGPSVTFARSAISAQFPISTPSLLDLAEACDVPARWSCRTGVCQTCLTGLLSGEVSYSPAPLDTPSDGQVLICCARPDSDVVVDM